MSYWTSSLKPIIRKKDHIHNPCFSLQMWLTDLIGIFQMKSIANPKGLVSKDFVAFESVWGFVQ